jgi:uncharacterized protein with HEPN domain
LKPSERDPVLYLEDIIQSMDRVEEYIHGLDFKSFKQDYKTVDAVIRNFEIIGEASKNLPKDIKEIYSEIPWDQMYRLRNRISHEYFGIDYDIIWDIASNYLKNNKADILKVLEIEKKKR